MERSVLAFAWGVISGLLLAYVVAALAGCAAQIVPADAPYVPNGVQAPPAVVEASYSVGSLFTGDKTCSTVYMGDNRAYTDRHCYDAPAHSGTLGLARFPTYADAFVAGAAQHDVRRDVVVLALEPLEGDVPAAALGNYIPALGAPVWTVGVGCSTKHDFAVVHQGTVVAYDRDAAFLTVRVTPEICFGDSGGAVFDAEGKLVALNTTVHTDDFHVGGVTLVP